MPRYPFFVFGSIIVTMLTLTLLTSRLAEHQSPPMMALLLFGSIIACLILFFSVIILAGTWADFSAREDDPLHHWKLRTRWDFYGSAILAKPSIMGFTMALVGSAIFWPVTEFLVTITTGPILLILCRLLCSLVIFLLLAATFYPGSYLLAYLLLRLRDVLVRPPLDQLPVEVLDRLLSPRLVSLVQQYPLDEEVYYTLRRDWSGTALELLHAVADLGPETVSDPHKFTLA